MSSQDAFNYLYKTGATGFILECWDGLRYYGHTNIIDQIDEFIENNNKPDTIIISKSPIAPYDSRHAHAICFN